MGVTGGGRAVLLIFGYLVHTDQPSPTTHAWTDEGSEGLPRPLAGSPTGSPPAAAAQRSADREEKAPRRTRVRRNGERPSRCEERRASEEHLREVRSMGSRDAVAGDAWDFPPSDCSSASGRQASDALQCTAIRRVSHPADRPSRACLTAAAAIFPRQPQRPSDRCLLLLSP